MFCCNSGQQASNREGLNPTHQKILAKLRPARLCIIALLLVTASCSKEAKELRGSENAQQTGNNSPLPTADAQPAGNQPILPAADLQLPEDNSILPPANLAGAYLVDPKLSYCRTEESLTELTGFCAYELNATATGRQPLDANGEAKVLGSTMGGLAVDASSEPLAIAAAQKQLIAAAASFRANDTKIPAAVHYMFKYGEGKVLVYARASALGAARANLTGLDVKFGTAPIKFENNFDYSVSLSNPPTAAVATFETTLFQRLRSLGAELAVVSVPQLAESKEELVNNSTTVSANTLIPDDVLAFLGLGRAALDAAYLRRQDPSDTGPIGTVNQVLR
jgi:hypothetical protein